MASNTPPSLKPQDLFDVSGLVAVVTGGHTGIGLMMAKALEENGATVFIVGRRKDKLEAVAKQEAKHGKLIPLHGDVTDKSDLTRITTEITNQTGFVNLVIANAGVQGPEVPPTLDPSSTSRPSLAEAYEALWAPEVSDFAEVLTTNLAGTYFTAVAFLPLLDAGNRKGNVAQSSQVIVTGSAASYARTASSKFAYGASKAGGTHLVKKLATTLVPYSIRVNCIEPGFYPSEMTSQAIQYLEANPEVLKAVVPLGRVGDIADMAGIVLWLASKAGAWITGNIVLTDGGILSITPSTY